MRLLPLLLILCTLPRGAAARGDRPDVDLAAIREAMRASPGGTSYASSRAYAHYLNARLAEQAGDAARALEELQLAVIYDDTSAELRVELAWQLARSEDLDRAALEVNKAIRLAPDHAPAHLLLGKIRAAQHRRTEAVSALERAIELRPGDPEAWLALAKLHADFGAWTEAERVARRFERTFPRNGGPWRLLAATAWERSDEERVRRYLQRAVRRDPEDMASRLRLAALEHRAGASARAAALYEEVLRIDPAEPEALLGAGRIALASGDAVAARAYFQQLLGTARDPVGAALQVASAWRGAHLPDEALAILDGALREAIDDPRIHFTRGLLLDSLGRHDAALEAFGRVPATAGPLHAAALARQAESLSLLGRHEAAAGAIRRAIRLVKPGSEEAPAIWEVVPNVFRRAGRPAEAIEVLQAHAAGERDPALTVALAESLLDLERHDQAQALLAAELVESPGDTGLVFALAAARERAGDVEGAVGLMQAVLRGDPDNASALNFVGYVWADRGIRLEEAHRMLRRAVELRPEEPYFLDSLGWCEVKRGNVEAGALLLERARARAPREAVVLHHLAAAYVRLGRFEDAAALWTEALSLLDRDPDPRVRAEIETARREAGMRAERR